MRNNHPLFTQQIYGRYLRYKRYKVINFIDKDKIILLRWLSLVTLEHLKSLYVLLVIGN